MTEVQPIPKSGPRPPKRRRPLPQRSQKRIDEAEQRDEVRRITLERAGHRCQGPDAGLPGRCGWIGARRQLEVHEPRQRSTHPGSHLDAEDTVALCPVHHDQVSSPSGEALQRAYDTGMIVRATS